MEILKLVNHFVTRLASSRAFLVKIYLFVCLCITLVIMHQHSVERFISVAPLSQTDEFLGNGSRNTSDSRPVLSPVSIVLPVVTKLFNTSCPMDLLGRLPRNYPDKPVDCSDNETGCEYNNLTCRNLLSKPNGKDKIYEDARLFMSRSNRSDVTSDSFMKMTSDCDAFRRTRGFERKAEIQEDGDFSIAFNLLVHRNLEMVERLIYGLYRRQHQFCLHVDTKSDSAFKIALLSIARCLPNVFIASKLEDIVYAGFSRLQADINCMTDHLKRSSNWQYVINTAGEAYPLRSQKEMIHILRLYNGSNDIEGIHGSEARYLIDRYRNEFVERTNPPRVQSTRRKNSKPPHDIEIVKGSAYGVFSRGFVQYLLTDPKAQDLLQWMRTTYSPDELFWSTLNYRYVNPHLHAPGGSQRQPTKALWMAVYANWEDKCYGKFNHGICISGIADLPNIVKRQNLFVNKFHSDFQPLALDCLREWIDHKEICPVDYNYEFYKQLNRQ